MYNQFEAPNDFRGYILHSYEQNSLAHHGILGMHWGIRRFQNKDGSLTSAGKNRYGGGNSSSNQYNNNQEQPAKLSSHDPDGFKQLGQNENYAHKKVDERTTFLTETKDLQRNDDLSTRRTYQEYKKHKNVIDKNWDDAVFNNLRERYSESDSRYGRMSDGDLRKIIKDAHRTISADSIGELFMLVSYSLKGDDHYFEFEYSMKDNKARSFAMNG